MPALVRILPHPRARVQLLRMARVTESRGRVHAYFSLMKMRFLELDLTPTLLNDGSVLFETDFLLLRFSFGMTDSQSCGRCSGFSGLSLLDLARNR